MANGEWGVVGVPGEGQRRVEGLGRQDRKLLHVVVSEVNTAHLLPRCEIEGERVENGQQTSRMRASIRHEQKK
jgi:hypothetical protein